MTYYDLSPIIDSTIAVFPGDVPFQRSIHLSFENKNNLLLSSLQSTLHIGSHADAPNHYHPQGVGIHQRDLNYYMGSAQVVRKIVRHQDYRLKVEDFLHTKILAPRLLIDTASFPVPPNSWVDDFMALSPELIDYFHSQGVILVGLDTPSVDPSFSKSLETHQKIFQRDMAILEGLILKDVPEGLYHLIALPLKIKDADASPVRAILMDVDKEEK